MLRTAARNALASLVFCAPAVMAGPYTGTAAACSGSTAVTTCKVDLTEFMKSKFNYTYNGHTYTSDSTNLNAAANSASTSSFRYMKSGGQWIYHYYDSVTEHPTNPPNPPYSANSVTYATGDVNVKEGFMTHPRFPNVLMHSKTGTNTTEGGTLEMFHWATGNDNAMVVLSEPQWSTKGWYSYFMTEPAPNMQWIRRGYFWADKVFDVTYSGTGWQSAVRTWGGSNYLNVNSSGATTTTEFGGATNSVLVRYLPAESGSGWINAGLGELPTTGTMEVLEVVVRGHNSDGSIYWWEKFDYARQKLADGSYNYFGLVRFQNSLDYRRAGLQKCVAGVPPSGHSNATCGDYDLIIESTGNYNAFHDANSAGQGVTIKNWYDTALLPANKKQNDPKFTKRVNANDTSLPHNRGGFVPPGPGADAKNASFLGSSSGAGDMIYLENTTVEQDWYLYPNGEDPITAPAVSPTNYCREGYQYLGSLMVTQSYNGLTGTTRNTAPALHWVIMCGKSTDAYLQASDPGSASCNTGYVTRGYFANPNHASVWTCAPGGSCSDQSAKGYVNLCVSGNETPFTFPDPNP